jgi:hypothetical protein
LRISEKATFIRVECARYDIDIEDIRYFYLKAMIAGVKKSGKCEKGLDVALYKPVMVWNHYDEEARTPDRATISGTDEAPLPLKEPGGTRTD